MVELLDEVLLDVDVVEVLVDVLLDVDVVVAKNPFGDQTFHTHGAMRTIGLCVIIYRL